MRLLTLSSLAVCLACCSPPSPAGDVDGGGPAPAADAGGGSDGGTDSGVDAGEADGGAFTPDGGAALPLADALDCKSKGVAGGIAPGTSLQRYDFDVSRFPDALCNDGTPAVIYFRPGQPAARTKWVVQLQGGGACRFADDCARRWCSVDTNFGAQQMSAAFAPTDGMRSTGILAARPENAFRDWNLVYVHYCSSDSWVGTARDQVMLGHHPLTGTPVAFRAHFLGARIVEAVLEKLRQVNTTALRFDADGTAMPNLDDATEVVLAGASAGGSGTIQQLDRVAATVRATNRSCGAAPCAVSVRGLIDSSFGPAYEQLDFRLTDACTQRGICTYPDFMASMKPEYPTLADESCVAWHAAQAPSTAFQCTDSSHIIRHHLGTPFFVRMGQRDSLHIDNATEAKLALPGASSVITAQEFALKVREDLVALSSISMTAHEGSAVTAPGVYGPTCPKHETLESTPDTYDVFINPGMGERRFFDVWSRWTSGSPASVVTVVGATEQCPP